MSVANIRVTGRLTRPGRRISHVTRSVTPARGIVGASSTEEAAVTDDVTIYLSEPDETIERLAQLDSTRRPSGAVLVAAVSGEPVAALPLDGGPAIADPFQRTAALVSLLELRVAQMRDRPTPGRLTRSIVASVSPALVARHRRVRRLRDRPSTT
jgi:hypothetical protein